MEIKTQRTSKQHDPLVNMTTSGLQWSNQNRRSVVVAAGSILLLILLVVGGSALYTHRTAQAADALGAAMQAYQTPVANPNQPLPPGTKTYSSITERATAANKMFLDVADHYGMTKPGKVARYFAGLTYMEAGQNQSAEDTLKKSAGSMDTELSALSKLALAQLYRDTGRNPQAEDEYKDLAKGHSVTVPPGMAQIKLAELYSSEGKDNDARRLYAEVKDKDKDEKGKPGPLATIAEQKLNPQSAANAPQE